MLHEQARIYAGHEKDKNDVLIIQRLLDYGISANAKNKQGMTPLHVHLENWNVNTVTNAVSKRLEVRFQERSQMLLLELLQRYWKTLEYTDLANSVQGTRNRLRLMPKMLMALHYFISLQCALKLGFFICLEKVQMRLS